MGNNETLLKGETMNEKFLGQYVNTTRRGGNFRGVVEGIKKIYIGKYLLLVRQEGNGAAYWFNSRKCRVTYL